MSFSIKRMEIPIFVIVHNQYEQLIKSVKSYESQIHNRIKIIFHDVCSTYPPTLKYLEQKKKEGHLVYRTEENHHHTVMNSVKDYLKYNTDCKYYVLTDPDIVLENVYHDILEFYIYLLEKLKLTNIGPFLRIDNIPDYYPQKKTLLKKYSKFYNGKRKKESIQFIHKRTNDEKREKIPKKEQKVSTYEYMKFKIERQNFDTCFHLYSINYLPNKFPKYNKSNMVKCYAPYNAVHLDWYIDPENMSPCEKYYSETSLKNISHWNIKSKVLEIENINNYTKKFMESFENEINNLKKKIKFYFINLDSRKDRLKSCMQEFKKINLKNVERFSAIKPSMKDIEKCDFINIDKLWKNKDEKYVIGSSGCKLSHYHVLKKAYNEIINKQQYVCVLEDDVSFHENIWNNLNNVIQYTEKNNVDFDILYLGVSLGKNPTKNDYEIINSKLIKLKNKSKTATAILFKKDKLKKILNIIENSNYEIDDVYQNELKNRYSLYPMMAYQKQSYSDIMNKNVNYENLFQTI